MKKLTLLFWLMAASAHAEFRPASSAAVYLLPRDQLSRVALSAVDVKRLSDVHFTLTDRAKLKLLQEKLAAGTCRHPQFVDARAVIVLTFEGGSTTEYIASRDSIFLSDPSSTGHADCDPSWVWSLNTYL